MRFVQICLVALMLAPAPVATAAMPKAHIRLLMHGTTNPQEGRTPLMGVAGWLIAPDITADAGTWMALLGPRLNLNFWNLEFLAGGVTTRGIAVPVFDIRISHPPKVDRFLAWSTFINPEVILTDDGVAYYLFAQGDLQLPWRLGHLGLETENLFQKSVNEWAVGVHWMIPMGHLTLVWAYQYQFIHTEDELERKDHIWVRTVLTL